MPPSSEKIIYIKIIPQIIINSGGLTHEPWMKLLRSISNSTLIIMHPCSPSKAIEITQFFITRCNSKKVYFSLLKAAPDEMKVKFQQKFILRLKLDWIWAKNLQTLEADVEGDIVISDHRPLWVDLSADSLSAPAAPQTSN